jgi:hypothetical protein
MAEGQKTAQADFKKIYQAFKAPAADAPPTPVKDANPPPEPAVGCGRHDSVNAGMCHSLPKMGR